MLLPLLLIVLSTGAAAIMAYGTHPGLAHDANGLHLLMLTRRVEWPLIAVSLILCMVLLGLVISNKRRAWWLIGLAPVLALFVHRFAPPKSERLYVVEFAPTAQQLVPSDESWVVGVRYEGQAYALPYSALYRTPVVFITDYDKRIVVFWSAHANRAMAFRIARDFKARDLEIVTTPGDSLLLYDSRLGNFIVAATGLTPKGEKPVELVQSIPTIKATWGAWRKMEPATHLMRGFEYTDAPAGPILPRMPDTLVDGVSTHKRIALIPTTQPLAIDAESVTSKPINASAGPTRLLIFRDSTQRLRVFDRNVKEDLFPTFKPITNKKFADAALIDSDSNSLWTMDGKAIDGALKGTQMKELHAEDELYWGVMKFWYPQLTLQK